MPATISHALSMTTPDDPLYENRPSHWNATHALTLSATGSEIVGAFSNANGLSFGLSAGAITASHNALTTAALSDHSHGSPSLALTNLSGTTASNSAGFTLSLSAGAGGAGDGVNILAAGTQTANTTGSVLFNNANGISFGLSNSSVITASHNALTTAMASNRGSDFVQATAAFAGTSASGTIASNGISISIGPYLTTAMQSNAATISNIRVSAGTTSNLLSAVTFGDGNGISFGLNASTLTASHNGLTSQSNQNVTAANGGFAFQTLSFSNLNGISFGTSAGSAITASHNALTTARASTDAVGLNTAQTNVTWTVNSGGLSLNAAGYAGTGTSATNASITLNSNGLAISVAAPGGGVTPVASASNGSFSFTTLGFSNANNVTFGTSAGSIITASVAAPGAAAENNWFAISGNTAGNTTASGSTIVLSAGNNVTLSGTNGSVIRIDGNPHVSYWQNIPLMWSAIVSTSVGQSTSIVQPIAIEENLSINRMRFARSIVGGATSVATVANTSWGFTQSQTHNYVWMSYGAGANSNSLQAFTSTSYGVTMTVQGSVGAASNNLSVNRTINAPMSTGNSAFTFSTAPAGSASLPFATTDMSAFISGVRLHDSNFAASFPAGLYFLVHGVSTNGATGGATAASALTACTVNFQLLAYPCIQSNIASFGTSAQSFNGAFIGAAMNFSTAGGGTTGSLDSVSRFTSVASNPVVYLYMDRIA